MDHYVYRHLRQNGLTLLGVSPYSAGFITGFVILMSVAPQLTPPSSNENSAFVIPTQAATAPSTPSPRPSFMPWFGRDPTATMRGALIVLAIIFFSALAPSRFLSLETARAMAFQMPELGTLALAMMILTMSGGLNLAIIATANLSALVVAATITKMIGHATPPQAIARVIALAARLVTSSVVGLITGAIVAFLGVHPILVTLGTMRAVKGIVIYATNGGVKEEIALADDRSVPEIFCTHRFINRQ
jgi:ribose/xylose/arabinose/galactoside ABC-type transport system permease subunit